MSWRIAFLARGKDVGRGGGAPDLRRARRKIHFASIISAYASLAAQPSLILESPVNCNRRLAFQLIDARYASPRHANAQVRSSLARPRDANSSFSFDYSLTQGRKNAQIRAVEK